MNVVLLKLVPPIPFPMVDDRLEKHGLSLKRERKGVAVAGQRGRLLARIRKGETYFELVRGEMVVDILDAIEVEYGVEVIDENDGRYSGKSDDVPSNMSGIISGEDNIVVAGPTGHLPSSGKFIGEWLRAAELANAAFQDSDLRRMMLNDDGIDLAACINFRRCALWLLDRSIREDGSFVVNLQKSLRREMIVIMMKAGFLRLVGQHYEMATPSTVDNVVVEDMLVDFFDTDTLDRERYGISTMNRTDARQLAGELRAHDHAVQGALTGDRGKVLLFSSYRKDIIKA